MGYARSVFAFWVLISSLSSYSQDCNPPIVFEDFYAKTWGFRLRDAGHNFIEASVHGEFILLLSRATTPPFERYIVWYQWMGPDGILTQQDAQNIYKVGDFYEKPIEMTVSPDGWMAFVIQDPTTGMRPVPVTPHPLNPPGTPPFVFAPRDKVLYTCHVAGCSPNLQRVFTIKPQIDYITTPPNGIPEFIDDARLTRFFWDGDLLVFSYVQDTNPLFDNPPWAEPGATLPPPQIPHTAVVKFDPMSGTSEEIQRIDNYSGVETFRLSKSANSPYERYAVSKMSSGGWYSQNFSIAYHRLERIYPIPPSTLPQFNFPEIPAWAEANGPSWGLQTYSDLTGLFTRSSQTQSTPLNPFGLETLALRAVVENQPPPINIQLKDIVFRSSLNGFAGPNQQVTPADDQRAISKLELLNHPTPTISGEPSFVVAAETWAPPNGPRTTDLYIYQPGVQQGQIGSFQPYRRLAVGPNESSELQSGSAEESLIFWLTRPVDPSMPQGPTEKMLSIARCP